MKMFFLILWLLISLILVLSVIGLLLFMPPDTQNYTPSTWYKIGLRLVESVTKE